MERLGPAPRNGVVFIPGYYFWNPQQAGFVWIDPMWAAPPVPGALWIPPNWTYQGYDQWNLQEGYWQEPAMPETQDDGPCFGHYAHPGCPSTDNDGAMTADSVPSPVEPEMITLQLTAEELSVIRMALQTELRETSASDLSKLKACDLLIRKLEGQK